MFLVFLAQGRFYYLTPASDPGENPSRKNNARAPEQGDSPARFVEPHGKTFA